MTHHPTHQHRQTALRAAPLSAALPPGHRERAARWQGDAATKDEINPTRDRRAPGRVNAFSDRVPVWCWRLDSPSLSDAVPCR